MTAPTVDPFTGEPMRAADPSPDPEQAVRNAFAGLSPLARCLLDRAAANHGLLIWLDTLADEESATWPEALAALEELTSTVAVHAAPGGIGRVQWLARDVTRVLDAGSGETRGVVLQIGPWTQEAPAVAAELGVRPWDEHAAARWWGGEGIE